MCVMNPASSQPLRSTSGGSPSSPSGRPPARARTLCSCSVGDGRADGHDPVHVCVLTVDHDQRRVGEARRRRGQTAEGAQGCRLGHDQSSRAALSWTGQHTAPPLPDRPPSRELLSAEGPKLIETLSSPLTTTPKQIGTRASADAINHRTFPTPLSDVGLRAGARKCGRFSEPCGRLLVVVLVIAPGWSPISWAVW
jgi:hypothetical protein